MANRPDPARATVSGRPTGEEIDINRVVWDPDYRAEITARPKREANDNREMDAG